MKKHDWNTLLRAYLKTKSKFRPINFSLMCPSLVLLSVTLHQSHGQLVGSRGVVALPEGFVYHDNETLDASKRVAEYAKKYQAVEDHQVAQNQLISLQQGNEKTASIPKYQSSSNDVGKPIPLNEILSFENTRTFITPVENRMNVPLAEIEKERDNGKIRLLPGEGVIPSQKYAPKSTNRFEASITEESERAKNKGETIFDDGVNETKLKYQYKGRPILKEYYDKYFGKTKHAQEKIEAPRSSQSTSSLLRQLSTNKALSELPIAAGNQNVVPVAQLQPQAVSTGYQQSVAIPQGLPQVLPVTQGYPQEYQQGYPQGQPEVLPVPQGYPQGYPQEYPQGYPQAPIFNPNRHYSYLVNHG